jgi:hypothetical protein
MKDLLSNRPQLPLAPLPRAHKIVWTGDEYLLTKCRHIIQAEQTSGVIKYGSVSSLIRASLTAYQTGQLSLTVPRQLGNSRRAYSLSLPPELYQLYTSWPARQRAGQLERILLAYLNTI